MNVSFLCSFKIAPPAPQFQSLKSPLPLNV